jgi:hypothetical protein
MEVVPFNFSHAMALFNRIETTFRAALCQANDRINRYVIIKISPSTDVAFDQGIARNLLARSFTITRILMNFCMTH